MLRFALMDIEDNSMGLAPGEDKLKLAVKQRKLIHKTSGEAINVFNSGKVPVDLI